MKVIIKTKEEKKYILEEILANMQRRQMTVIRRRGTNREYIIMHATIDREDGETNAGYTILSSRDDVVVPYTCQVSMISKAILEINHLYSDEFRFVDTDNVTITVTENV